MTKLALAILLAVTACGVSVTETPLHPSPTARAARPAASVELFAGDAPPSRPYVEVSELAADPQSVFTDDHIETLITGMRARAGALGCDGLIVTDARLEAIGGERARLIGRCIVYRAQ